MISRFAVEKSYFRPSDNSVKPKAFLPGKDGTTSVFCLDHLDHPAAIAHGQQHVGSPRGKQILGYARVSEAEIARVGLTCDQKLPPPFHHEIAHWPDNEDELKSIALDLAEAAVFIPT